MAIDVPSYIQDNAKRGLSLLEFKGSGLEDRTIREARRMARGEVSEEKVKRMWAFFTRQKSNLEVPKAREYLRGDRDRPTPAQVSWLLWGGDITSQNRMRAMRWAERTAKRLDPSLKKESDMDTDVVDKAMKTEDGIQYPARAYAYVPDSEKPSTWKLRLWDKETRRETAAQVGLAVAALGPGGFRGNRVQIPASDLPQVKRRVLAAWLRTNDDKDRADAPAILKGWKDEYDKGGDYGETAYGDDAMTHLMMAYRLMMNHADCEPLLAPLMRIIQKLSDKMVERDEQMEVVEIISGGGYDELEKVIVQRDNEFCVISEDGERNFGCYDTEDAAKERLAQVESFAEKHLHDMTTEKLVRIMQNLETLDVPDSELLKVLVGEEWDRRNAFSTAVCKATDEDRYTLGPVYIPGWVDAHGDFADDDTLTKALWDWVRKGDRSIRLQHTEKEAGEMVEIMTWPFAIQTEMIVPGEEARSVRFPPNTPFMGVVWKKWAWDLVKNGDLRGYSMGGRARRLEADFA
jgi:hypothetical protein